MSLHKFLKVHLTSIAYEIFITGVEYSKQDHAQKIMIRNIADYSEQKTVNLALRC